MNSRFTTNNKKPIHTSASLIIAFATLIFTSCNKTDYLDVAAADRAPLSAKVSFVNARPVDQGINFLTYTTQVNTSPVAMNKTTPYMDAQFGLVQINIAAPGSSSYLASRVF